MVVNVRPWIGSPSQTAEDVADVPLVRRERTVAHLVPLEWRRDRCAGTTAHAVGRHFGLCIGVPHDIEEKTLVRDPVTGRPAGVVTKRTSAKREKKSVD